MSSPWWLAIAALFCLGCVNFGGAPSSVLLGEVSVEQAQQMLEWTRQERRLNEDRLQAAQGREMSAKDRLETARGWAAKRAARAALWAEAAQARSQAKRDDVPRQEGVARALAEQGRAAGLRVELDRLRADAQRAAVEPPGGCCVDLPGLSLALEGIASGATRADPDELAQRLACVAESLYEELSRCSCLEESVAR